MLDDNGVALAERPVVGSSNLHFFFNGTDAVDVFNVIDNVKDDSVLAFGGG